MGRTGVVGGGFNDVKICFGHCYCRVYRSIQWKHGHGIDRRIYFTWVYTAKMSNLPIFGIKIKKYPRRINFSPLIIFWPSMNFSGEEMRKKYMPGYRLIAFVEKHQEITTSRRYDVKTSI